MKKERHRKKCPLILPEVFILAIVRKKVVYDKVNKKTVTCFTLYLQRKYQDYHYMLYIYYMPAKHDGLTIDFVLKTKIKTKTKIEKKEQKKLNVQKQMGKSKIKNDINQRAFSLGEVAERLLVRHSNFLDDLKLTGFSWWGHISWGITKPCPLNCEYSCLKETA